MKYKYQLAHPRKGESILQMHIRIVINDDRLSSWEKVTNLLQVLVLVPLRLTGWHKYRKWKAKAVKETYGE